MKVACIQLDVRLSAPEENFASAVAKVRGAAANGADTILLPETLNVGFFPKEGLREMADKNGARTKEIFGALAAELGVNIVAGSVANLVDDKVYNTSFVFDRKGSVAASYNKTHLFSPMEEHVYFTPGEDTCVFELDGHRCGLIICYDVRFPELTRMLALAGIEILFIVSQWPEARRVHWQTLTRARAIENQMFLACCNGCGYAGETHYGGCSAIYDPLGNILAAAEGEETTISAECDFSVMEGVRSSINVFRDRRNEFYHL